MGRRRAGVALLLLDEFLEASFGATSSTAFGILV